MQDAGAGGFRPYDPSKGSSARPAAGTAPVELKKESGSQEVRTPTCQVQQIQLLSRQPHGAYQTASCHMPE